MLTTQYRFITPTGRHAEVPPLTLDAAGLQQGFEGKW